MRAWRPFLLIFALLATPLGPLGAQGDDTDRIDTPGIGARLSGRVEISGRAVGPDLTKFDFYRLYYGPGPTPTSLRPIGPSIDKPVERGVLGVWDTSGVLPGEYLVQLTVYDKRGNTTFGRTVVTVDQLPTPTPLINLAPIIVPTPSVEPSSDQPEAPPQDFTPPRVNIPQINAPVPLPPAPLPVQQVEPINREQPRIVPIQIDAPRDNSLPPLPPINPIQSAPIPFATPSFDPGPPPPPLILPSQSFPLQGPSGPPAPIVAPYEPPPPLPTIALPTPFGLPL